MERQILNNKNDLHDVVNDFYKKGHYQKLIKYLKKIENKDENPTIYWFLAHTYFKLHNYSEAEKQLDKFIQKKSKDHLNLCFLGEIFLESNQFDKAQNTFKEVLKIDKNNKSALLNLIKINLNIGNIDAAEHSLKNLLKKEPQNYAYHHSLIRINKKYLDDLSTTDLEKDTNFINNNDRIYSKLILAQKMELKKEYKSEIENLITAHKIFGDRKKKAGDQQYNYYVNLLPQFIKKIENIDEVKNSKIYPIFIMGLPRSGTTLVEKIVLSGNNSIQGLGETDVFDKVFFSNQIIKDYDQKDLLTKFNYSSKGIYELSKLLINQYQEQGLKKINHLFTDKSISSFLYIELINKIFPNSKFVFCYRNPLANLIGLLRVFLPNIFWSHFLDKTFNMFNLYYNKLNKIKKDKTINLHLLSLEELTSNPELISKSLYKFLDLKWTNKALKFKKNSFITKTASNIQIKDDILKHNLDYTSNYEKIFEDLGFKYDLII